MKMGNPANNTVFTAYNIHKDCEAGKKRVVEMMTTPAEKEGISYNEIIIGA
ncbi:MAG TPA: hypothetical protein VMH23_02880 [Bacteroidota bacterium]|nr:hypothetical protein [Bacteroidota bacterium]